MKDRITKIVTMMIIAGLALTVIVCVNTKLGDYLRTTNLVDVYYYCSEWHAGEVADLRVDSRGNLVIEGGSPSYTTYWEQWRENQRPFNEKEVQMILGSIDIAVFGIGVFACLAFLCFKNRSVIKGSIMLGVLGAFVLASCFVINGVYFHYKHNKNNTGRYDLDAPIIYLYDEQSREVSVKLELNGDLTHSYPSYNDGWTVKTSPDGTLTDSNGRQYEYLFWEANADLPIDLSTGFCVKGEDTADFLEKALSDLGLSDTEANTFIMYWLPQMESNPYNVISFQTTTYEAAVVLDVDPVPDTVIRVNMAYYGTSEYVEMQPQDLTSVNPSLQEREGLVLVEWGGEEIG